MGGESILWVNGCLCKEEYIDTLVDPSDLQEDILRSLVDSWDFHAGVSSSTYISPADVIWMPWLKEVYSNKHLEYYDSEGHLREFSYSAANVEVTYDSVTEGGEEYVKVPSGLIREVLGIDHLKGINYEDKEGKVQALHTSVGNVYRDGQDLLLARASVLERLRESGYVLFWIVRLLRKPTVRTWEKYNEKFNVERDKTWIIWRGTDWNVRLIDDTVYE